MSIRLSWSLLAILVIALFLGAMRGASEWAERAAFYLTYGGYVALTLLALVAGRRRPGLLGFVLCGWAYFVPVFAIATERWVNRAPTTTGIQSLATAMVVHPEVPAGNRFEVAVTNGQLQAKILGTAASVETMGLTHADDRGIGVIMELQSSANRSITLTAGARYIQHWQRAVTFGHLALTLLCSSGGMVLGIGFDRLLRNRERSAAV